MSSSQQSTSGAPISVGSEKGISKLSYLLLDLPSALICMPSDWPSMLMPLPHTAALSHSQPKQPDVHQPPRRAFVSLAARGEGHFAQPYESKRDLLPDYLSVIASMLCSFRLWRSRYPMIILASNVTSTDIAFMLTQGASRVVDVSLLNMRRYLPTSEQPATRPDCSIRQKDGRPAWFVANRGDFIKTLLKAAAWNLTEFDEVI
jgi:hypothetical protein